METVQTDPRQAGAPACAHTANVRTRLRSFDFMSSPFPPGSHYEKVTTRPSILEGEAQRRYTELSVKLEFKINTNSCILLCSNDERLC